MDTWISTSMLITSFTINPFDDLLSSLRDMNFESPIPLPDEPNQLLTAEEKSKSTYYSK
jgi:hypothetical protein